MIGNLLIIIHASGGARNKNLAGQILVASAERQQEVDEKRLFCIVASYRDGEMALSPLRETVFAVLKRMNVGQVMLDYSVVKDS